MMAKDDALLLLGDGVYGLLPNKEINQQLFVLLEGGRLYALEDDFLARGITTNHALPKVPLITYEDFVDLVTKHQRTYNWV